MLVSMQIVALPLPERRLVLKTVKDATRLLPKRLPQSLRPPRPPPLLLQLLPTQRRLRPCSPLLPDLKARNSTGRDMMRQRLRQWLEALRQLWNVKIKLHVRKRKGSQMRQ